MSVKGEGTAKRPISQFSVRNKLDAIQRVHNGESKASVARSIGVPESTLRGWCKSEDKLRNVARSCGFPEESFHSESDKELNEDTGQSEYKRSRLEEDLSIRTPLTINTVTSQQPPIQQTDVNEALMFWLKQQQQVSLSVPVHGLLPTLESTKSVPEKETSHDSSSWFWRWYKRYGYSQFSTSQIDMVKPNGEIVDLAAPQRANGYSVTDDNTTKSTLDTLLLNNNVSKSEESDEDDEEDEPPATAAEAVQHGEKFLRWLECCSDPSVTAMQILQFRYLLNNVRACAERKAKQANKIRSRRK